MHAEPGTIRGTIAAADASEPLWDVIVVGAGPAGALAARQLALAGHQVLLIDKRRFPRDKVCGACFSDRCCRTLAAAGLEDFLALQGAIPIHFLCLSNGIRKFDIPLQGSWALSRSRFDAALVRATIDSGVSFLPESSATVLGRSNSASRTIQLTCGGSSYTVRAQVLIAADGLGSPCTAKTQEFPASISPRSRIGLGTTFASDQYSLNPNTIHMLALRDGYMGAVQLEDGQLHFAAAVEASVLRRTKNIQATVRPLLDHFQRHSTADSPQPIWHGTPTLTRMVQRPVSHRVFLIGDAAGYIEPFTGEGIAWALESALAVIPLASRAVDRWDADIEQSWLSKYQTQIRSRQYWCRMLAFVLRHPPLTRTALFGCQRYPALAHVIARTLLNR